MKSAQHEEKSVWHDLTTESDNLSFSDVPVRNEDFPLLWTGLGINCGEAAYFASIAAKQAGNARVL